MLHCTTYKRLRIEVAFKAYGADPECGIMGPYGEVEAYAREDGKPVSRRIAAIMDADQDFQNRLADELATACEHLNDWSNDNDTVS